jgi:DNA-directed RNA polymerase specialized sigma24 family protein
VTAEAGPIRGDPPVTDLVTRARNGEQQAWDALVERYAPLIWSISRRYRLSGADADDVGQTVWLHLVDQLDRLRDPAALVGWLATTTQRECLRVRRAAQRPQTSGYAPDIEDQHWQRIEASRPYVTLGTRRRSAPVRKYPPFWVPAATLADTSGDAQNRPIWCGLPRGPWR